MERGVLEIKLLKDHIKDNMINCVFNLPAIFSLRLCCNKAWKIKARYALLFSKLSYVVQVDRGPNGMSPLCRSHGEAQVQCGAAAAMRIIFKVATRRCAIAFRQLERCACHGLKSGLKICVWKLSGYTVIPD